jgi:predicted HTH transcriptional regulator
VIVNIITHEEYFGGESTKNPNITKLLRQIGRVEELGLELQKLYKL